MRKVRIVSRASSSKMLVTSSELEEMINTALREISEMNGAIIKTEYCVSRSGYLESMVIEYEIP